MPKLSNQRIGVRCTSEERAHWEQAAEAVDERLSDFIRQAVNAAADKIARKLPTANEFGYTNKKENNNVR